MRQKIENKLLITVPGVDLTHAEDLTVFMTQDAHEWRFWAAAGAGLNVDSATQMTLTIPYETAMQLLPTDVKLQACWIDGGEGGTGAYRSTDPITVPVGELIAKDGFAHVS